MEKVFKINGNHLTNLDDFYLKIEKIFIKDKYFDFGKNLDALNDVLYGGYGAFDEEENITLIWENFDASKKYIKEIKQIEEIISENKHINFKKT